MISRAIERVYLRRVGSRYRIGAIAVMISDVRVATVRVRSKTRVTRGDFIQRRYGTHFIIRRLIMVRFFRPRHRLLLIYALHRHLTRISRTYAVDRSVGIRMWWVRGITAGIVVTAQRQPSYAPIEIIGTFTLEKYKYQLCFGFSWFIRTASPCYVYCIA